MYCSTRTLKYTLLVINLICALFGSLLIWYGAWLLASIVVQNIDHGENLAANLCILLGMVILLTTIFGIVSIFMESKTMIVCYAVLLIVLLIVQIIMINLSYAVAKDKLPTGLKQGFEDLWDPNHTGNSTLSYYEQWLQCCGKNSAQDYFLLDKVPTESCCFEQDCTNVLNLYLTGCEEKFHAYVHKKTGNFNLISWLLMLAELAASFIACYLVDSIRNYRDHVRLFN